MDGKRILEPGVHFCIREQCLFHWNQVKMHCDLDWPDQIYSERSAALVVLGIEFLFPGGNHSVNPC